MKKLLWLDEEDSVVGSRSDRYDKIATDRGSKITTENRITAGVTSATGPDLVIVPPNYIKPTYVYWNGAVVWYKEICAIENFKIDNFYIKHYSGDR